MNYTKISRKQANVVYRNMKEGNITMKDDLISFMYERADAHLSYNTLDDATEDYLLGAVDAIFKNDFSKAQECIDSAWISFGSTHGLLETETVTTTEIIAEPVEVEATCTSGGSENTGSDATAYSFVQFNGNCGSEEGFSTLKEAMDAAEVKWDHLTDREKAAYTKPGNYFLVIEGEISEDGEIGAIICDFTEPKEERITEWTGTERISSQGNSLSVSITKACKIMGLGRGDVVEVTIRKRE